MKKCVLYCVLPYKIDVGTFCFLSSSIFSVLFWSFEVLCGLMWSGVDVVFCVDAVLSVDAVLNVDTVHEGTLCVGVDVALSVDVVFWVDAFLSADVVLGVDDVLVDVQEGGEHACPGGEAGGPT